MLVERLVTGAVDVVGDVHGELDVLESLIDALGYDKRGHHRDGRTLVFVGDLIDRGPKSLAVVDRVRGLVEAGRAQCVLGNHELNVLRHDRKEGNDWFFDSIRESEQIRVCRFLATLPLALEREDLRVVHACWHEAHIARLRTEKGPVVGLSQKFAEEIEGELAEEGILGKADREAAVVLTDRDRKPPFLAALAERNVRRQNRHPIKVLTSGLEEAAKCPFWAGGKWRFESRVRWWDGYSGPMVVVGHYWRSRGGDMHHGKGEDLFSGTKATSPLGRNQRVMCIDYSIGRRNEELGKTPSEFRTALAAYRWPEAKVKFAPA